MRNVRKGIDALKKLVSDYNLTVKNVQTLSKEYGDFKKVDFSCYQDEWSVLISDEYDELRIDRPLLAVYMVLDALYEYCISDDFLQWCNTHEVSASNSDLLAYYQRLEKITREIRSVLGDYESILQQIDFQFPWRDSNDASELLEQDE